jgi:hypothetical protein
MRKEQLHRVGVRKQFPSFHVKASNGWFVVVAELGFPSYVDVAGFLTLCE